MNKNELLSSLRGIVKEELTRLLNSKEGRALIKELISRGVRSEVDRLLTDMEQENKQPVIQEANRGVKVSRMIERGELPPKNVPKRVVEESIQPVTFTKNSKLNNMLNQTLVSIARGEAQLPSALGADSNAALLREQYGGVREEISNPQMSRHPLNESSGKSVMQMLPDKDVNGNPLMINATALPDHVQNALTRDYRKLMKKVG